MQNTQAQVHPPQLLVSQTPCAVETPVLTNPPDQVEQNNTINLNPQKGKPQECDSDEEQARSVAKSKGISSDHGRSEYNLTFPTSFRLDIEYNSPEEIMRILRREQVQLGLPAKFMKQIHINKNEPNHNIIIRCRTCNSYLDFRNTNGKYTVAVLRNRHTHGKEIKTTNGNKEQEAKKEMPKPKLPFPTFQAPSSIKIETNQPSGLKSYLQNLRVSVNPNAANPGNPLSHGPPSLNIILPKVGDTLGVSSTASNVQPIRNMKSKFKQIEDYLVSQGYDLIVDQGRQPPGAHPQIILAVSPTMKRNFQRFGDLVSFHIVQLPISETSQTGHNYRLGVFIVYSYNRKQLLAGVTFLCRQTAAAARTAFEFFLKLHGKHPESISTSHEKEICLAISQLQDEGVFTGIHMVDSQQALQSLEAGLKVRNKLTREVIDLCTKVVSERNKSVADKIIGDIQQLIEVQDQHTQKATLEFLNQRQKIFVSSLPTAFLGIFDTSYMNRVFDDLLAKKLGGADKSQTIEIITRALVSIDGYLLDQSFDKIAIYQDCIEDVFYDPRIKHVRDSLDSGVFKIFIQNYTEAVCFTQIKPTEEGENEEIIKVANTRSGDIFELQGWTCTCQETKRTGLPCPHLLAVAIETKELSYMSLIKERWREREQSTVSESEAVDGELSQNLEEAPNNPQVETKNTEEKALSDKDKIDEEKTTSPADLVAMTDAQAVADSNVVAEAQVTYPSVIQTHTTNGDTATKQIEVHIEVRPEPTAQVQTQEIVTPHPSQNGQAMEIEDRQDEKQVEAIQID